MTSTTHIMPLSPLEVALTELAVAFVLLFADELGLEAETRAEMVALHHRYEQRAERPAAA